MAKNYFAGGNTFLFRTVSNETTSCLHTGLNCQILSEAKGRVIGSKTSILNMSTDLVSQWVLMLLEKW